MTADMDLETAQRIVAEDRAAKREAELAEHRKLIGRCFKYHNSYGGDRPKWWLYAKVLGTDGYWPYALSFQRTNDPDEFKMEPKALFQPSLGWQEITEAEYQEAAETFKAAFLSAFQAAA